MTNNRICVNVPIEDELVFKNKLLKFYRDISYFTILDSNGHDGMHSSRQWLAGAGNMAVLEVTQGNALEQLRIFYEQHQDWLLGYLSYDLKNELEQLSSNNHDSVEAALLHFFVPEILFSCTKAGLEVQVHESSSINAAQLVQEILKIDEELIDTPKQNNALLALDSKDTYINKVQKVLNHIYRGDIYEANFCTQFQATDVKLDSLKAYAELNAISKSPFAVYASFDALKIMCASPERYIKKNRDVIISQPIKGTARRSVDTIEDEIIKKQLEADPKERSENVMIVDLVRNDLSRIATKGSVEVEELFGMYSFEQVHQMISTISAQLLPSLDFIDLLKATFPMGSMTGAPKLSAMKIIEQTESFKRGLYSGAIGYVTPQGDIDFNVVIRSILYNTSSRNLSISVGSAITASSVPSKEYDECLLKARALLEVLAQQGIAFS